MDVQLTISYVTVAAVLLGNGFMANDSILALSLPQNSVLFHSSSTPKKFSNKLAFFKALIAIFTIVLQVIFYSSINIHFLAGYLDTQGAVGKI